VEIFDSEIAVRSPALTSGYLDVPQLNREAFRDGWFFTGDLGKRDDQGRLYIVGRKHVIVDVGGRKVDPQEVEEVILQHAAVAEAVVVGVNLGPSKAFLKAVIVTQYPCSSAEIADHCKERLAAFKCPSAIEFVDALPKTALGKIKRGDLIKSDVPAAIGPSLPAIERFLRLELSGLLKRDADAIGSSQLIMEQGITSAQAVQLAARIQSRMAISVPATLVWNYPTIASITRWIMDRMTESPSRRLFGTQTLSEASIEGTRILGERGQLI
jgi:long-chain acyl-CoA synthetase